MREARTVVNGYSFDLINNQYYLLLATGSNLKGMQFAYCCRIEVIKITRYSPVDNSVGYHDINRIAAGSAQRLSDVSVLGGTSKLFLRLHGAFMLTAWIGTASVGILLARYFKQTWVGSQLCGKDQWFAVSSFIHNAIIELTNNSFILQWHRIFMVLTWSLTIAAAVLIWLELRDWSQEDNPHAILGTITTIVCFIQPFGALFRPAPTSSKRPIFNWLHWLGGNVAHICASKYFRLLFVEYFRIIFCFLISQ